MTAESDFDPIEALERLGLPNYEARVFVALQKLGTGTAKDVSTVADVPRSQVYGTTESLERRGLIEIQHATPKTYRPVPIEEARERLRERFERNQERAFDYLEKVENERSRSVGRQEGVWRLSGTAAIESRANQLIANAESRIVYGVNGPDMLTEATLAALHDSEDEGVSVIVLSDDPTVRERLDNLDVVEPAVSDGDQAGRLLVVDDDTILMSVLDEEETAVWSARSGFARASSLSSKTPSHPPSRSSGEPVVETYNALYHPPGRATETDTTPALGRPTQSSMNRTIVLSTVLLVLGLALAPAPVAAAEDPRFETYVPEPTVTPGQTAQVTVQFVNDAEEVDDRVETARNVKATMVGGDTPFTVSSGTHLLGSIPDGRPLTSQFVITVPEDVEAGTYEVPIRLTYEYDYDEKETTTVYATVTVEDRAAFELLDVESDLSTGESGTVSVTIRNVGTENASAATVELQSKTGSVRFGDGATTSTYVGEWPVGANRTVSVDAKTPAGTENGTYAVAATVAYDDEDGIDRRSFPMTAGVTVGPAEDRFLFSEVESTLRVGEDGTLRMTVTNNGALAKDAVVRITSTGMNVHPDETEYAVGTLEPHQSVDVSFPITVSSSASAVPRQFSFVVEYQTADEERRQTRPLNLRVAIEPERDRFAVEPIDATLPAGGSDKLTLSVTNNGETTIRNVNAKLFANDPLSTTDDEAFVSRLEPGETTEMTFGVGVSGGAYAKTYPLSMDFTFDENGDSKLSKTYQVPVTVTEPSSSGLPVTAIVAGVVILVTAVGGYVWYRRR
ncbi:MAG: helix-turn-helix domain-containing protein [Halanaeroarchaeum sp.]